MRGVIVLLMALAVGVGLLVFSVVEVRHDGRRMSLSVTFLAGLLVTVVAGAGALSRSGTAPHALFRLAQVALLLSLVAYPLLTIFLLANGVTMWRRERGTLAHRLTLLLGLGMLALPIYLGTTISLAPQLGGVATTLLWLGLIVLGMLGYVAFCFAAFLVGTFAYRRTTRRFAPRYVVILGAGLRGRRVTPLLARRLDRAVAEFRRQAGRPVLIPSGGRGADEEVSEGRAMADYLLERGVPADHILVEDRATNTRENLLYARDLMDDPTAPTVVTTSNYHVFRTAMATRRLQMNARVRGAKVARYYAPSAFLREFAAIMLTHKVLNGILVGTYLVLALGLFAFSRL